MSNSCQELVSIVSIKFTSLHRSCRVEARQRHSPIHIPHRPFLYDARKPLVIGDGDEPCMPYNLSHISIICIPLSYQSPPYIKARPVGDTAIMDLGEPDRDLFQERRRWWPTPSPRSR